MAETKRWPWALNQPGFDYPAEYLRAQHFDATSGGNGVSSPSACKVIAQPAADGTVLILPGGATMRSTYAGAENQSYQMTVFQPITFDIPPTGSASGGRNDLLVLRLADPQYGYYPPGVPQRELTPEEAADIDFWWPDLIQGVSANTKLDYPHVKLAHIRRDPNETIVRDEDIYDLRSLANPRAYRAKYDQMVGERTEVPRTGTWRVFTEVPVEVPEWATHAAIDVSIGGAYFRGSSGRGAFGMTGLGNTSAIGHTPWWEEGGDATSFRRIPYMQAGRKLNVREEFRGKTSTIYIQGRVDSWSDTNFVFGADYGARAFVDVDWLQDVE